MNGPNAGVVEMGRRKTNIKIMTEYTRTRLKTVISPATQMMICKSYIFPIFCSDSDDVIF